MSTRDQSNQIELTIRAQLERDCDPETLFDDTKPDRTSKLRGTISHQKNLFNAHKQNILKIWHQVNYDQSCFPINAIFIIT